MHFIFCMYEIHKNSFCQLLSKDMFYVSYRRTGLCFQRIDIYFYFPLCFGQCPTSSHLVSACGVGNGCLRPLFCKDPSHNFLLNGWPIGQFSIFFFLRSALRIWLENSTRDNWRPFLNIQLICISLIMHSLYRCQEWCPI